MGGQSIIVGRVVEDLHVAKHEPKHQTVALDILLLDTIPRAVGEIRNHTLHSLTCSMNDLREVG